MVEHGLYSPSGVSTGQDPAENHLRQKIVLISFLCSLFVIYIHTVNLSTYGIGADAVGLARIVFLVENYFENTLKRIAVPFFFLISGFLLFRNFSMSRLLEKYHSRVKSLLLPYLIWGTAYFLFRVGITQLLFRFHLVNTEPISFSAALWLQDLLKNVQSYHLWFLRNLILFVLVTPLIYLLMRNFRGFPSGLLVLVLLYVNQAVRLIPLPNGLEIYCFGALIGINYKDLALRRSRLLTLIGSLLLLFMFATAFRWYQPWMCPLLFLALWFALDLFSFPSAYPWWMRISFFTYVSHLFVLESLEKIVLIVFGKKPLAALLDFLFMPIVVFILLVLIAALLRKWFPRLWLVLTGSR